MVPARFPHTVHVTQGQEGNVVFNISVEEQKSNRPTYVCTSKYEVPGTQDETCKSVPVWLDLELKNYTTERSIGLPSVEHVSANASTIRGFRGCWMLGEVRAHVLCGQLCEHGSLLMPHVCVRPPTLFWY